jgi:hypothetical protein
MFVLTQDHDQLLVKGTKPLLWHEVKNNGKYFGCNLLLGKDLLGTFDTPEEAQQELCKINDFTGEVYIVSGYSDYNGGEDFDEILRTFNQSNRNE